MPKCFIPIAKPLIGLRERRAVDRVLRSGGLAQGPEVAAFEKEFSEKVVDGRPCVAVNSGTSGQHLGLLAAGIGPGDEIIVPSFTFAATANSVALTGATPVFADIRLDDYCLDPSSVESVISRKTVGIMPVHLYGHPAPMKELQAIADKHKLALFEDAAQAHLADIGGQKVGTFGQFAMFSLYPTKNMTSGEGGMVACEDDAFARKVRLLRNQGMEKQYENEIVGLNNRMTDIHAAIGRVQLRKLEKWTDQRIQNADYLTSHITEAVVPQVAHDQKHVFHQYTIRTEGNRGAMVENLRNIFGVGSGVYYPIPNHLLPSLQNFRTAEDMSHTLQASQEVVSLPVHPSLRQRDLKRIVRAVNESAGTRK